MTAFGNFVQQLADWGIADVLLPFLLIFTIVFAVLQKTEVLGKGKKNFNVMVALVMGLAVVFPHVLGTYPPGADPVLVINSVLPDVALWLVGILMLLLLIGLMGGEVKWLGSSISGWFAIIGIIIVSVIFAKAVGWVGNLPNWLSWLEDPDTQAFLVIIIVFGILIWFITKDDTEKKSNILGEVTEGIGKMFGGGK